MKHDTHTRFQAGAGSARLMERPVSMHAADITDKIIRDGQYIERMVGRPAYAGLFLMKMHFKGSPWVTVQQVAEGTKLSEDTTRRRLTELVGACRAEMRQRDSVREYRIMPDVAEQVLRGLNLDFDTLPLSG